MIASVFVLFLLTKRPMIPNIRAMIANRNDMLLIIGIHEPRRAIGPKTMAKIPKTLLSTFLFHKKPPNSFYCGSVIAHFLFLFYTTISILETVGFYLYSWFITVPIIRKS